MRMSFWGKLLGTAALLAVLFVILFPIYWMAASSVKTPREVIARRVTLVPQSFTTQHYEKLLSASNFPTYTFNSAVISLSTMIISVSLAVLAGYGVYQTKFVGRRVFLRAMLVAYAFPTVLLLVPLYFVLSALGLLFRANHRERHADGAVCSLVAAGIFPQRAARCDRCCACGRRRTAFCAVADCAAVDRAGHRCHRHFLLRHILDGVFIRLNFDQHRCAAHIAAGLSRHHRAVSN
jgi:hypothetical protein